MLAKVIVSPDQSLLRKNIEQLLEQHSLKLAHPDVLYFDLEAKLGVDAAKKIREHINLRPIKAKVKGVVLEAAQNLTLEAQNALLKTLEEPAGEAIVILGTTQEDKLLPTIISRCEVVHLAPLTDISDKSYFKEIEKVINSTVEERFIFVEKLEEKEQFLSELTYYLKTPENLGNYFKTSKEQAAVLELLLQAQIWKEANVNIRAILEYLMLKFPIQKS